MFENKSGILLIWFLNTIGAILGYFDIEAALRMFAFATAGILSVLGIIKWCYDWFLKKK